ncbi:unnamed protein product [Blepharisma stoltei]|uniref:Uncharacterized protein n=1 Tax=Blepharisma stoltei TaxID=1481888 RepID=A0AAU9IIY2_9CILI|nr:unnamed protein product [Blepharisma stoltei]
MSIDLNIDEPKPQVVFVSAESLDVPIPPILQTPFFGGKPNGFVFHSPKSENASAIQEPEETNQTNIPHPVVKSPKKWNLIRTEICGVGIIIKGYGIPEKNTKSIIAETEYTYDLLVNRKCFSCIKYPIPTNLDYKIDYDSNSEIAFKVKEETIYTFCKNLSNSVEWYMSKVNFMRMLMTIIMISAFILSIFGIILIAALLEDYRQICVVLLILPPIAIVFYAYVVRSYVRKLRKLMEHNIIINSQELNRQGINVELGKNCIFIKFSLELPMAL